MSRIRSARPGRSESVSAAGDVGERDLVGRNRLGAHLDGPHRIAFRRRHVYGRAVPSGEFRGVPVGHREAALLGTVGLIAAADRFRAWQEGWIAVCGSEPELDLEEPVGIASPLGFLLGIDQEEGDEPVAVMPAGTAPQDHVRVVGVELLDR
jgi:hypothetical protein